MTDIQALGCLLLLSAAFVSVAAFFRGQQREKPRQAEKARTKCDKCKALLWNAGSYGLCAACIEAIVSRTASKHQADMTRLCGTAEVCGFDPAHAIYLHLKGHDADELCQAMIHGEMKREPGN